MKNGVHMNGLIFFDLETSGLDSNKHEIIQIAAIHASTSDKFECKIVFDVDEAQPEALAGNCYDKETWEKEAISPRKAVKLFSKFLQNHKSVTKISKAGNPYEVACLGGWNVNGFDKNFIINLFKKYDTFFPADYRMFDFYPLSMMLCPYLEQYNLSAMSAYYITRPQEAHDALGDVIMTMDVASCLLVAELFNDGDERLPDWAVKCYSGVKDWDDIPF